MRVQGTPERGARGVEGTRLSYSTGRRWGMARLGLAAWILALTTVAAANEAPVLRLGSDEWPPFTGSEGTQRAANELVDTALERAGIHTTTVIDDWKAVEAAIRRGDLDGSAAMWRTERRERDLVFSRPYLENRLVLIGRSGSDVSATRMSDLAGKRVAAVGQYAYGDAIENASGVYFVNSRNDQDSLDKLLAGEVDYMLVDELVARYLLTYQTEEAAAKLEIGITPLARRDVPNAERIVSAFNTEIGDMMGDGTYAAILQVGWIRVDADGDGLYELIPYGDYVTEFTPGSIYDVFGEMPEEQPPEKQRVLIRGDIYEGWDAIPERYKVPPSQGGPTSFKYGTTVMTLKF